MGDLDVSLLPGNERFHHLYWNLHPKTSRYPEIIVFGFLFSRLGFGLFVNYPARID